MSLDLSFYSWELIQNFLIKGLLFSVQLTVVATLGGIAFGTILALMRLSNKPWLTIPASCYVNVMRSIPLVMVILWFFLLIPTLIGRPIGADLSAYITFIAFEAAFFCEIVRAGIGSIPKGQALNVYRDFIALSDANFEKIYSISKSKFDALNFMNPKNPEAKNLLAAFAATFNTSLSIFLSSIFNTSIVGVVLNL